MMHRNAQTLGDAIREFFEDNAELRGKILEIRVMRAWGEILGPMVAQYTRNIYVKDKVLYVSLTSSVLRSELVLCRDGCARTNSRPDGASGRGRRKRRICNAC